MDRIREKVKGVEAYGNLIYSAISIWIIIVSTILFCSILLLHDALLFRDKVGAAKRRGITETRLDEELLNSILSEAESAESTIFSWVWVE